MPLDARALQEFYEGRMGQVARLMILQCLRSAWPDVSRRRILGIGYAAPYLKPLVKEAERTVAATPEALGTASWASAGRNLSALVDEEALPFPEAFFDCILVVHGLELSEAQRPFLRELWRVLAPSGRLIVVAPNRASLWAHFETTPFGHGRPYSRSQLTQLLEQALFHPERWEGALFMPPFGRRRSLRVGTAWERLGTRFWPQLAGVHIVEATKAVYAPVHIKAAKRQALKPATVGAMHRLGSSAP